MVARWATTDMILNFFILATFYFFIRGYQEEDRSSKNYLLAYTAMSLGFLTKGPPALLIPVLVVSIFLVLSGQWKSLIRLKPFSGIAILLAINLPWFGTMWLIHGDEFKDHILNVEIRDRLAGEAPLDFYFIWSLFRYSFPWCFFLVSAMLVFFGVMSWSGENTSGNKYLAQIKNRFVKLFALECRSILFCLLGILVPLVLFVCLRTQHSRYLLPVFPFVAAILGAFFVRLEKSSNWRGWILFKTPFFLSVLFYGLIALGAVTVMVFYTKIEPVPFRLGIVPFVVAFGISLLTFLFFYKKIFGIVVTLAVLQLTMLVFIFGDALPFYSRYPMKKFKETTISLLKDDSRLAVYGLGNHRAKLGILMGKTVYGYNEPELLLDRLDAKNISLVAMKEDDWEKEFSDEPFILVQKDIQWKWKGEAFEVISEIFNRGVKNKLEESTETIVLLKYVK
jgi:4-amino-4-deoxy-L-arabinose transferase-like glycosyltransferase